MPVEILFENIEELKISECGRRQTLSLCVHYKRRQQQKQLFSLQNFLGEFFISHPRSPCPKVATPATKNINNFFRVIQKRIWWSQLDRFTPSNTNNSFVSAIFEPIKVDYFGSTQTKSRKEYSRQFVQWRKASYVSSVYLIRKHSLWGKNHCSANLQFDRFGFSS